ncbi:MAG: hypothetical protein ACK4E8_04960 [Lacibacter sp.]|jgi:hypothetical protein
MKPKDMFRSLLAVLLLALPGLLPAQDPQRPNPQQEERIKALEVAFISRKLQLSTEEAQKFWPVYNEYKRDMQQLMQQQRTNPDRDVVDQEQKMLDIRKKYRDRFSAIIGPPRMNQFFQAEQEFRGVLLNRLKNQPNRPMLQRRMRN